MSKVTSEIYKETDFKSTKTEDGAKIISIFKFQYPTAAESQTEAKICQPELDKDGDLIVTRKKTYDTGIIEIEHSEATEIKLVGLQVWRGSLLLADFMFYNRQEFRNKQILELGAGVGLTAISAAMYAKKVTCTDVDIGGILNLIRRNVARNQQLIRGAVEVIEYDFMQDAKDYSPALINAIDESEIIVAADVIYDDDLTDAFVNVLEQIFARESLSKEKKRKCIYIALEKRYVFTLAELDAVAPMFEYFLRQTRNKPWRFEYVPLETVPQYFEYERCKELILLKVTNNSL